MTGTPPGQPPQGPGRTAAKLAALDRRRAEVLEEAEARAEKRQHAVGKLSARERLDALLDPGSLRELDAFARHRSTSYGMAANRPYGDGVITGTGTIDGRPVCVFSQDFSVFGGSLGEVFGEKIVKVMDLALRIGCPVIGINDSGGARIQEGVVSLGLYGEIFYRNTIASGVVPQVSIVMGPCAGGAVYSPALTDFTVMVDGGSHMFITGPDVIRAVTGEDVGFEELGGARTHNTRSGVAHYLAADEHDALDYVRALLSYLPSNNLSRPPVLDPLHGDRLDDRGLDDRGLDGGGLDGGGLDGGGIDGGGIDRGGIDRGGIEGGGLGDGSEADLELDSIVPDSDNQPYDMHEVIARILDDGELLEVHELFAPNIICAFGRIAGRSVGVVANQPMQLAGTLDIDASEKAARFVRTCDAFNVPILTFVDVPGFLPGTNQEWSGIIRRGAKLIFAYAEATVPKVTVITRKAYGGAYDVMGSKHLRADVNLAWPTAQIAVMGADGAVNILHRREIAAAEDPAALRGELSRRYEQELATPWLAAERGYVDAVIRPSETRREVTRALELLSGKHEERPPKKHGNIPL